MSEPQARIAATQPPLSVLQAFDFDETANGETESDVPALENGDRLTWQEFEQRYDAMPELKKAELIKGVVYMGSPVKHKRHSNPHSKMIGWLFVYSAGTPGTESADNGTTRLDDENTPQPDGMLRLLTECGGNSQIDEHDYLVGAPELAVEVASSSASYDLHDKKDVYGQFGVREYIVWRTRDRKIDWFRLENNQYIKVELNETGVIESSVFPGLRLNVPAMLAGNMAAVLAELQTGLDSLEHATFVEQLAQRKTENEKLKTEN